MRTCITLFFKTFHFKMKQRLAYLRNCNKPSEKKLDEGRLRHGLEVLKGAILPEGF